MFEGGIAQIFEALSVQTAWDKNPRERGQFGLVRISKAIALDATTSIHFKYIHYTLVVKNRWPCEAPGSE